MSESSPTVLLIADILESHNDLPGALTQEWEGAASVNSIKEQLETEGEIVELVESPSELIGLLHKFRNLPLNEKPVLFHLVEGFLSRNREAWLPALGEYSGFPHTGSDAYAQSLSLDKHASKLIALSLGLPTADWGIWDSSGDDNSKEVHVSSIPGFKGLRLPAEADFPVFYKPNGEGSSLGISDENHIQNLESLYRFLEKKSYLYGSWVWESFLPGEEWTVAIIGSPELGYRASNVGRVELDNGLESVYGERTKTKSSMPERLIFDLDQTREANIQELSIRLCEFIGTAGAARLDWKANHRGEPQFLEWNLTPGLSPYYSTFPICYTHSFGTYSEMLKELIDIAREEFRTERFSYSKIKSPKVSFDFL
ncbi:D-alanine--D-alanine ligase [Leptospira perolatii]|uniref:D-alanine--D-alanine ligase n=1 Tax=Leptospira perolatii TaxID=2023191 RepID=A0A2M9ZQC5_9LEPT|nr:D-alanine--D-alanine ligase [Leptospira perolatii]PJZ69008.1 D-alanine--D-alanine ligase [Leptospira perolatii]PJZ74123.1 D-alanine--D-alanine ligase [Leptospira perolatii]